MNRWTVYYKVSASDVSTSAKQVLAKTEDEALRNFRTLMQEEGYRFSDIFVVSVVEDSNIN